MNKKALHNQLTEMKGKTFTYANKIHYIKDVIIDTEKEKFKVITNLEIYDRKIESMADFLSYWTETSLVHDSAATENTAIQVYIEQENSLMGDLVTILKDNITKVQTNKEYIAQATAINNNVNTIVNIAKMKLDVIKMKGRKQ